MISYNVKCSSKSLWLTCGSRNPTSLCGMVCRLFYMNYLLQEREAEFTRHIKDRVSLAKSDFKQLLKEIKCVSHKSKEILRGPNGDSHMREIRQFLTVSQFQIKA